MLIGVSTNLSMHSSSSVLIFSLAMSKSNLAVFAIINDWHIPSDYLSPSKSEQMLGIILISAFVVVKSKDATNLVC